MSLRIATKEMKKLNLTCLLMTVLFFIDPAYALEGHTELWTSGSILKSFSNDPRFKYYLEPQLRLIDNRYTFNQTLMLGGLGYQAKPDVLLLGGLGYVLTKSNSTGDISHEYRLWEQLSWNLPFSINVVSRTRLEERKLSEYGQIAFRLRERVFARIPFAHWTNHSLAMFDEVFFNLNRPVWVAPHFFAQNRAFIGIGTELSKTTMLDVGYLNQYVISSSSSPNQMKNVLSVSFTVVD